jgi:hypothetical protein
MIYDVLLSFDESCYIIFSHNLKLLLYIWIIVLRCVGGLRCSSMGSYA